MDTTQDQVQNPNTTFVPAPADPAPAPTVVAPEQRQAIATVSPATRAPAVSSDSDNGQEFPHPAGASGQGGALTVQSEPTPQLTKPPLDPRPYAWVKQHNPELAQTIDDAAEMTGVSPQRIAWHAWKENRFRWEDAPNGAAGEIGMMQILPSTAKDYTMNGKLDPSNPHDNVLMGALYMRDLDGKYGQDSPLSVARYNGSGPQAAAYARSAFPGGKLDMDALMAQQHGGSMSPKGLVKAGSEGGPDGFLRYAVQTAPHGMPTSDVWRTAEASLVQAFVEKGDIAGAQHARDFVLQMSHTGMNQNLMAAHQALTRGDGVAAANFLAKAHAFFPDGTIGQFRTDGHNVYAERIDENNPKLRIGPAAHIGPQDIAGMLNQTTDPGKYLATLTEQQKAAADARLKQLHGDYYAGGNARATERAQATVDAADIRGKATVDAAAIRSGAQGNKPDLTLSHAIDKEADAKFDPKLSDLTPEQAGSMSEIYRGARVAGGTPPQAERIAHGLSDKTLNLIRLQDGNYGVVSAAGQDKRPIGYLPKEIGDRYAPPPQQQRSGSPVGAGASSAYAMGQGVSNNLSGTVMPQAQTPVSQSSALPVR